MRTPQWVSPRRQLERALSELRRRPHASLSLPLPLPNEASTVHPLPHIHIHILHAHFAKRGLLTNPSIPNSLLHAYSSDGPPGRASARKLFDEMPLRDRVSWNSILASHIRSGDLRGAREVFDGMPERDSISWNTMLDGYSKAGEMGEAFALFERMPGRDVVSWSTLVSGYCRKGDDVETARRLFDEMPVRNSAAWAIVVAGYVRAGHAGEAVALFDRMLAEPRLRVDYVAVISILAACARSGLCGLGKKVHGSIHRIGLKFTTQLCNALLDMYCKCGHLDGAWRVFNTMDRRDRVSWNSMIHCLAVHGCGKSALSLFNKMKDEGIRPDGVSFVGVLCACMHAGLVEEGRHYFAGMERDHGVAPQVEHYGCMVDLLGRGGLLNESFELINSMPFQPSAVIYGSFLGACRKHRNVDLAEMVLDKLMRLDSPDSGVYATLSNIYARTKCWDGMAKVRLQMKHAAVQKPSGFSYIEVGNGVHEFTVADRSHPQTMRIMQMLERLDYDLRQAGYVPNA